MANGMRFGALWAHLKRARRGRALGVALALALAATIGAGAVTAQQLQTQVTTYSGCLATAGGTVTLLQAGDTPAKPCGPGQALIRLSSGDITSVSAGSGLNGGGTQGEVSLGIQPSYQLPQTCANGQLASWNGANSTWTCATDLNTTYAAGPGLNLTGTTFSVDPDYRLPQGCSANQIAKWNGNAWTCQADQEVTSLSTAVARNPATAGVPDDGAQHPMLSVTLPSTGQYLVMAKGKLLSERNVSDFSNVGCSLAGDSNSFGSATLNDDGGTDNPFALMDTIQGTASQVVAVNCHASSGADGISVGELVLVAVKLS